MSTIIVRGKKMWEEGWQPVTLLAGVALTSLTDGVGDTYYVGDYDNMVVLLEITADDTQAADKLDVKLDGSWDNVTFYNMGEFTQAAGDAGATVAVPVCEMMQFVKGLVIADPDALLVITADAGATVVRPSMCSPYLRVTSTITRANGTDEAFSFTVKAYVQ